MNDEQNNATDPETPGISSGTGTAAPATDPETPGDQDTVAYAAATDPETPGVTAPTDPETPGN
jgi:hypothetical protein